MDARNTCGSSFAASSTPRHKTSPAINANDHRPREDRNVAGPGAGRRRGRHAAARYGRCRRDHRAARHRAPAVIPQWISPASVPADFIPRRELRARPAPGIVVKSTDRPTWKNMPWNLLKAQHMGQSHHGERGAQQCGRHQPARLRRPAGRLCPLLAHPPSAVSTADDGGNLRHQRSKAASIGRYYSTARAVIPAAPARSSRCCSHPG